ncbi:hypothetical protein HPO96_32620 [Kribbella sandramycini]|uniref:Uncharacterized protein n=1 Tax=Kribbella sandramycini TaxID=60450 RepID=A0A7Y4P262_9ACTN|nr:hypothetical protein [Kribbella sandramycini]MBB6566001.1 hypothetical protein [Kribbella sandramycini]NOL45002.1 hypothetical protein [Kribbella sandramycini]
MAAVSGRAGVGLGSGRVRLVVGGGYAAQVLIGALLAWPSIFAELVVRQLVGTALDAPWAPFGDDPEGKLWICLWAVLLFGVPLLLGAIAISRAVRRRLPAGRRTTALHYAVVLALLIPPILLIRAATTA